MSKARELLEEIKSVVSGKTVDAVFPPFLFVFSNSFFGLNTAVGIALVSALILGVLRLFRKENWFYALGGFLGVVFASGFAYLTDNAANYFIPTVISSAAIVLAALTTLVIGKPLAAWVSHLTRGWPLEWFWRQDIKPAYTEVTWLWLLFFLFRLIIHVVLLVDGDALTLVWVNTILGWPGIITLLIISYIYGIARLKKLKGPGVEEFIAGKEAPWKGQTRGF
ncbi:DUF3159 domain-containing protein [Salisediminibacterium halotolerans]|uniref:Intracellular septation protein A n=1 Tax=Salisediminibacterium halotolerans TaxID=517425 RepID=A0A1H9VJ15_9BACI|nr:MULTISPECIES: DUF3159 domain-containing protein [Salisediminibacterium]RLJ75513.1 uncharacterized protein DUF3159 [Actinophytocola xinjiangensis]RPE89366.1 uncharacterized protein DUF3159 [Salisediminibacterium halotolerans]TWG36126.1 uncharacterized protein DUF3159 [Salisediminibacterium halotolerans]SES21705.1 Protein of unknown function [Salisediminibacterium haloalkalitolerans]GEL08128.1 membrane protein [Salisediminibacterium halotolerans]